LIICWEMLIKGERTATSLNIFNSCRLVAFGTRNKSFPNLKQRFPWVDLMICLDICFLGNWEKGQLKKGRRAFLSINFLT